MKWMRNDLFFFFCLLLLNFIIHFSNIPLAKRKPVSHPHRNAVGNTCQGKMFLNNILMKEQVKMFQKIHRQLHSVKYV